MDVRNMGVGGVPFQDPNQISKKNQTPKTNINQERGIPSYLIDLMHPPKLEPDESKLQDLASVPRSLNVDGVHPNEEDPENKIHEERLKYYEERKTVEKPIPKELVDFFPHTRAKAYEPSKNLEDSSVLNDKDSLTKDNLKKHNLLQEKLNSNKKRKVK